MKNLTGNIGEWSEMYVLFRLLADGRIYAADANLNKLDKVFFPIIKIIREENKGEVCEYHTGKTIKIYLNGKELTSVSNEDFEHEADSLLSNIVGKKKGAFDIPGTEEFMKSINCHKLSAPSQDKADINMQIKDINTGYCPEVGFSIKSELGSAPTLLNAGKTTNFVFAITPENGDIGEDANDIYSMRGGKKRKDVKGRIEFISENGGLRYLKMDNDTFKSNLELIDSSMDRLIAETLLYYYRDGISSCRDMVDRLKEENPMDYGNVNAYEYKFKKFLSAVALGMKPATAWDGYDEANGGYIIVTEAGDVVAYHIYNRNFFEDYLLNNTKYDTSSTSRHEYGSVYQEGYEERIKLNLQIRFIK